MNRLQKLAKGIKYLTTLIGSIILILILGHYVLGAFLFVRHKINGPSKVYEVGMDLPLYNDFYWKTEFGFEQGEIRSMIKDPKSYYHWKSKPFEGKFLNVDSNGLRRTIKSPLVHAKKIFVFGGSTTWGYGTPDSLTIPSLLQQNMGNGYDVYNYGEIGFVCAQELNLLLELLTKGQIPEIVVFYDGINDSKTGTFIPAIPREPIDVNAFHGTHSKDECFSIAHLFNKSNYKVLSEFIMSRFNLYKIEQGDIKFNPASEAKIPDNALKTVNYYFEFIKQVKALEKTYGFRSYFFWQPNLLTMTRKMHDYEKKLIESQHEAKINAMKEICRVSKEKFNNTKIENAYFIGEAFDKTPLPIYWDWSHTGPQGNKIIADIIFEKISASDSVKGALLFSGNQ